MKTIKKFLFIPRILTAVLTLLCAVSLVYIFINGLDTSPIAYAVYVLSFYTLTVISADLYRNLPRYYKTLKEKFLKNPFGSRYMTDVVFKTHVSLYRSLAVNLLYVAVNIVSYFLYRSVWFAILAGYYTILSAMRFLLLRFVGRTVIYNDRILELKRSRLCGIILMTINLTLSCAVLMILYQDKGYEYHGILIYVTAMYTFYVTTISVINLIKYRKYDSPVMSATKMIDLTAALVSMLSLETAMLTQFGTAESPAFRRTMIASTGAGISAIVIFMSAYLIIYGTKEIKKLREYTNGR